MTQWLTFVGLCIDALGALLLGWDLLPEYWLSKARQAARAVRLELEFKSYTAGGTSKPDLAIARTFVSGSAGEIWRLDDLRLAELLSGHGASVEDYERWLTRIRKGRQRLWLGIRNRRHPVHHLVSEKTTWTAKLLETLGGLVLEISFYEDWLNSRFRPPILIAVALIFLGFVLQAIAAWPQT